MRDYKSKKSDAASYLRNGVQPPSLTDEIPQGSATKPQPFKVSQDLVFLFLAEFSFFRHFVLILCCLGVFGCGSQVQISPEPNHKGEKLSSKEQPKPFESTEGQEAVSETTDISSEPNVESRPDSGASSGAERKAEFSSEPPSEAPHEQGLDASSAQEIAPDDPTGPPETLIDKSAPDSNPDSASSREQRPEAPTEKPYQPQIFKTSWVTTLGRGASAVTATRIAVDSFQNVFVAATFSGTLKQSNQTFQSQTSTTDSFISKLSPQGKLLWTVHLTGKNTKEVFGVQPGEKGSLYITGSFYDTLVLGSKTLDAKKGGGFVAKIDSFGKVLWVKQFGDFGSDIGRSIQIDSKGNLILAGEISGKPSFGSIKLSTSYSFDAFVAKLNPQGKFLWAVATKGSGVSQIADLSIDNQDSIYLIGQYIADFNVGPFRLSSSQFNTFVARLTPGGVCNLLVSTQGDGLIVPYRILVTPQKNIYLTGEMEGKKNFGSLSFSTSNHGDFFVARMSNKGSFVWVKNNTGGTSHIHPHGLGLTKNGDLLLSGEYSGSPTFGSQNLRKTKVFQPFAVRLSQQGTFRQAFTNQHNQDIFVRSTDIYAQSVYFFGEYKNNSVIDSIQLKPGGQQSYLFVWQKPIP